MDIKFLKEIIGTESISANEEKVLRIIDDYAQKHKIQSFWQDKNIVFFMPGKSNKKALIFNGHVDTVSSGDLKTWKFSPFANKKTSIQGDRIYGLGASDMKGCIFAFIELAKYFNKFDPPIDIWFSFVVNEEVDGSGSKSFTNWFKKTKLSRYKKVAAIIGEPTGLESIGIGNKGNYFIEIKTFGDSGHGAYPERIKKHSVFMMFEICTKLQIIEKEWQKSYTHPILGEPTISLLTSIKAGDKTTPNKFPVLCSATFDIRTTPQIHNKVIKKLSVLKKHFNCEIICVYEPGGWTFTDKKEEVVKVIQKITGSLPVFASKGASDQYFYNSIGIPAVNFGPGEKTVIHKPDEFCFISKIKKSVDIYKEIIYLYST